MVKCLSSQVGTTNQYEPMRQCGICPFDTQPKCYLGMACLDRDAIYGLGDGRILTVKCGFCFDGASIPKWLWSLIGSPRDPDLWAAALFHDAMYHSHYFTRAEADQALLDLLEQSGVSWLRRHTIYRAVRTFGWSSYNLPEKVTNHFMQYVHVETL